MVHLTPRDVFVPFGLPIHPHNVYADRGEPQRRVETSWQRGSVPVIYGSYGTGKTSLAMYCARNFERDGRLVYIESAFEKTLSNVFERILEKLGYEVTVESTTSSEKERGWDTGAEAGGGLFGAISAKICGKLSRKQKKVIGDRRQLLIKSPTDSRLLDLCEERQLLLLIDEVHRSSEQFRVGVSAFLKAYANRSTKHFRIGLLGTEDDASRLVVRDPGIDRILQEVAVPLISADEAREIIVPGMAKLGIQVPEEVADRTVRIGVGSPFIVQYLCLEMAEAAVADEVDVLTVKMVEDGLEKYAASKAQRALREYHRAIETTGTKRYRKQILHAMARSDHEYVTMEELTQRVSRQLGEGVPSTTLSGPLRDLKKPAYGEILADVPGFRPDTRTWNISRFTDPAMKAIVRLVDELPGGDVERFICKDEQ